MRKFAWVLLALMPSICAAGSNTDTLSTFMRSVRMECGIPANSALPDTVLIDFASRSIVLTSTEIGGLESRYSCTTVAFQAFYQIPDTTIEIIGATVIDGIITRDLRAVHTQFFANESEDAEGLSSYYSFFDDSVQIYPIPGDQLEGPDTLYFETYVEHPALTAASDSVWLKADYQEAAKAKTLELIHRRLEEFQKADWYRAEYDRLKKDLRAKHMPKYDIARKPE